MADLSPTTRIYHCLYHCLLWLGLGSYFGWPVWVTVLLIFGNRAAFLIWRHYRGSKEMSKQPGHNNHGIRTHIMQGDSYSAFLVELRERGGQTQYFALDDALEPTWVPSADDAMHFARRSDAERMVDDAPDNLDIYICDHEWPGGTARDRIVPTHDWKEPD